MYKRQSSVGQVKSIKILVVEGEKDFTLSTQLDDESTIRILEVCLNKLKDKTSLNVVPIWERKVYMIKEKRNEVEVVLAVVNEYLNEGKDIPCEVMKYVVQELNKLEENYNKTINDLMNCNSLVVKMEQLFNLIGTIGTISIEDEDKLDKTLFNLENYVKSIKD